MHGVVVADAAALLGARLACTQRQNTCAGGTLPWRRRVRAREKAVQRLGSGVFSRARTGTWAAIRRRQPGRIVLYFL